MAPEKYVRHCAMKKTILLWLLSLVFITACSPKEAPTASTVQTNKHQNNPIAKLDFLVGNWAGPGISFASDGTESHYHDTEYVRFDLDQSLLLINARGETQAGVPSYQLHTVINYDKDAGHYWYTPYSDKGRKASSFSCNLVEQKFLCLSGDKSYRLTFQRLEDGKWNEFGERLNDGKWRKTFETILSPADD